MVRGSPVVATLSALAGVASAACHVIIESEITRPTAAERVPHPEAPIGRRPTMVVTGAGRLRFVVPLECPTEDITRQQTTIEVITRPNLATFTVGVIAAGLGGVMLTSGLFSGRPGSSPLTYVGLAGVGAGLPLAIGPWVGDRTELRDAPGGGEPSIVRRPGPSQPCGERPIGPGSARLAVGGIEVYGTIDRDGVFSVSPYQWIDAFSATSIAPAAATATLDAGAAPRTIEAVLDAEALAKHAAEYLAHADFDAKVEPLKLVPGIAPGTLRVTLETTADGSAVRVVLPIRNDGPGDAWGLRGQITAPGAPEIDGRMIYVGRLAKGAVVARELVIPLAPRAALAVGHATIELSVELRDAHGTAPATPVRFRGTLRGDAGR